MKVKAHLHLPKAKRGDAACISVAPFAYRLGQKTEYYGTLSLTNVKFKVSASGRERTLTSGVKNVHAWVVGDLIAGTPSQIPPKNAGWREAKYNPRIAGWFYDAKAGGELTEAQAVYMVGNKVYYYPKEK